MFHFYVAIVRKLLSRQKNHFNNFFYPLLDVAYKIVHRIKSLVIFFFFFFRKQNERKITFYNLFL